MTVEKFIVRSAGGKIFEIDGNAVVEIFESVYTNKTIRIPASVLSPGMILLGAGRIESVQRVNL
jgi:hypothetical protein